MKSFDLESWLRAHSTHVERVAEELVFHHIKERTSLLLPRDVWRYDLIPVEIEPLASFYSEYFGASIGNSQIIIATNISGGVDVSHQFRIPDIDQMTEGALSLGVCIPSSERVFIAEAGFSFFYTVIDKAGSPLIKMYDREFKTDMVISSLEEVLDDWWKIIENDP